MNILDRANAKGFTDYAIAKAIKKSRSYISKVRHGTPLSADVAYSIAETIGEDPVPAAFEALAAGARDEKTRNRWLQCLRRVSPAAAALVSTVTLSALSFPFASESIVSHMLSASKAAGLYILC